MIENRILRVYLARMQSKLASIASPRHYAARAEWLAEGKVGRLSAIVVALAAYFCLQVVAMTLLSRVAGTGVGVDDAEQLMYMSGLQAGYGGSQPPLYTWAGWLVAQLFGPSVLTLKIVKYAMMFAATAAIVLAVVKFGYSRRAAVTAMFGVLLFPQIFWEMQHTLSHSVAVFALCSLLLLALAWLLERRSILAYAVFGFVMGGAILAKYNDLLLIAAMMLSALSLGETRAVILNRRFAISIGMAALICLPTLYWNLTNPGELVARGYKFGVASDKGQLIAAWLGLKGFARAAFNFAILPVAVFTLAMIVAHVSPFATGRRRPVVESLLWRTILIGLAIGLLLVFASGATTFRDRWMLPLLLFLPVALAMRLDGLGDKGKTAQAIIINVAATLAIVVLPFTWYMHLYGGNGMGSIARIDYATLHRGMAADGPVRTVVSDWHWIGNLKLVDPDLTILSPEVPDFIEQLQEPAVIALLDGQQPSDQLLDLIAKAGYVPGGPAVGLNAPMLFSRKETERQVSVVRLEKATSTLAPQAK